MSPVDRPQKIKKIKPFINIPRTVALFLVNEVIDFVCARTVGHVSGRKVRLDAHGIEAPDSESRNIFLISQTRAGGGAVLGLHM